MRLVIFDGERHIGRAHLVHLDPPMGFAFGPFEPSPGYDRSRHANTIEGSYVGGPGESLRAYSLEGVGIDGTIAIEDWTEALGLQQLSVCFSDGNDYRATFGEHEEYKAYYSDSA